MVSIKGLYDKQAKIINEIFKSTATFHIINASRQSGKTYGVSHLLMALSLCNSDESAIVVAPTYTQTKVIYDNIINKNGFRQFIKSYKSSAPYEIITVNNFTIRFRSAERPDHIRSGSVKFVIADEFAFWKNDDDGKSVLMTAIFPMTTAKQDVKIIVLSTPNGVYNEFYDLYEMCNTYPDEYKYYTLHYSDKPDAIRNDKAIDIARASSAPRQFRQEYELEFIDSGGEVFENVLEVSTIESYDIYRTNTQYYSGIDFGAVGDKSVLTIMDNKKNIASITEYSGDYVKQINDMAIVLNLYKPITYAESNSMGLPIINMLKTKYSNIRTFDTTNSSKKEIIELLKLNIYSNDIKLPTPKLCPTLNKELNNYTFSQTKTGLISYHHRTGEHDDYVMSLAIANYAYANHNKAFFAKVTPNKFYQ